MLGEFVHRGGRIVSFDYGPGGDKILRGAGLTTALTAEDLTGVELEVVLPEHPSMVGVPPRFPAEEGTGGFEEVDGTVLVQGEGYAAVFVKANRRGGDRGDGF